MARRPKGRRRPQNSLRIIAGRWRSRKIDFIDSIEVRPTPDRIRETLFNWLGTRTPGSRCLDLFAGSGILSIEALSRGAASVTLVDRNPEVVHHIRSTLSHLGGLDTVTLHASHADHFVSGSKEQFDLVFLDPPFSLCDGHNADNNLMLSTLEDLSAHGLLADSAMVYVESPRALDALTLPSKWQIDRYKRAGDVHYGLLSQSSGCPTNGVCV